ncbi:unnamed protein product [Staurois parvus]|uniref:Uncharacterized protein n=1 Tax=Staurois parvus TaxID=386267 RepID=A0ABN9CSF2_9NEOB|nr:unnamed protein product [Staurois parvus]
MQTTSTNICEIMGHSQELIEFKRSTVIGCHMCNKSSHEISLLLNILGSTVSGIITKWKQLGTADYTAACSCMSKYDMWAGAGAWI